MNKKINRADVAPRLRGLSAGTIYSVTFQKKDGSMRLMNSIKGTSRGVSGEGLKYDASSKGLIPVYDLQEARKNPDPKKCWRMVNVNTVREIKINHEIFEVVD